MATLKEALARQLTRPERDLLRQSYDLLGDTAVIEVPDELLRKEKLIARTLLENQKVIKSVYKKAGAHRGRYRAEPVAHLAGEKRKHVFPKEWGCTFRVTLGAVFYSPRLSTERARIAKSIKRGEDVCVFFAGVGPYAVVFARHSRAAHVTAIEWSKTACMDMAYNVEKNKVGDRVTCKCGDVKSAPKDAFDRIVMPSPHTAREYFPDALAALKKKGTIHYYAILDHDCVKKELDELKSEARSRGAKITRATHKKVRPYSAKSAQYVFDLAVRKGAPGTARKTKR